MDQPGDTEDPAVAADAVVLSLPVARTQADLTGFALLGTFGLPLEQIARSVRLVD